MPARVESGSGKATILTAPALHPAQVILAVRADEACHSHVNHTFSQLQLTDENPFSGKGSELVA